MEFTSRMFITLYLTLSVYICCLVFLIIALFPGIFIVAITVEVTRTPILFG